MVRLLNTTETATHSIDFEFSSSVLDPKMIQGHIVRDVGYMDEDVAFLSALRATTDEFDDVLRRLAD